LLVEGLGCGKYPVWVKPECFQPVNAGLDLAVLARLLDAWTDVGVPQCDAVFVAASGNDDSPARTAPCASIQLRRRRP
jgi:hypothetical protein